MDIAKDLERIALQEQRLQFDRFDAEVAWKIGSALRTAALEQGKSVAIDITLAGAPLFYSAMPGTTPNNGEWIRRKKNVLQRFHKSTYAVGLEYQRNDTTLEARTGAPLVDFVTAGGCFPIRIKGSAAVLGSITVSGLPERQDHELVVRVLAQHLGVDPESLALDPA
ncbi:MAG TPA: heme-degrading domain-containing protein [Polyangiaceae bacterium]|nr:heme-degrading domain-containing protein [Polyangiaceae bacterium]